LFARSTVPAIIGLAPLVLGPVPVVPRCALAVRWFAAFFGVRFLLFAADFVVECLDVCFAMIFYSLSGKGKVDCDLCHDPIILSLSADLILLLESRGAPWVRGSATAKSHLF
jgi:hypothetical protein